MAHRINTKCNLCNACLPLCPTESVFPGKAQYWIDEQTCHDCTVCVRVCPVNAIEAIPKTVAPGHAPAAGAAPTKPEKPKH